jgi:hypothetical protein
MRFNGKVVPGQDGGFTLDVEQAYGNCRKYIQLRQFEGETRPQASAAGLAPVRATALSVRQRSRVASADTFFIASAHPEAGADASHRGGRPGFVRVQSDRRLSFPDYAGNNMFNTLGNLTADPRAGLLFVDFESGELLQLAGRARLVWEPEAVAAHRGARHVVVEFAIDAVLETRPVAPLRWTLVEPSPFNP